LQAFGIKQAIEAHRRAKPYTMGTIFWQIDDCWPVASWSSLDYYKRWKALHYIALKAFVPVLCAPVLKNDTVTVSIINDLPKAINGELQIVVSDFNGKQINSFQAPAVVDKLGNSVVWARPENNILGNAKKQSAYAVISLKENGKVLSENILYFVYPKDMLLRKPEITSTIEETGDGYLLKLSTNNLAKDVFVDIQDECQLSDNYFDLLPGSQKIITIKTGITKKQLIEKMKIHSLVDSY
jgi:beta-mannosidase